MPAAGTALTTDTLLAAGHTSLHNTVNDEARALGTKLGTGASTPVTSTVLRSSSNGTSIWGQVALTTDVTGTLPVANGGTGSTNLTFPAGPDTLVARGSTDTLTNKTLTSPVLTTPTIASFTNAQHNHSNAAGGGAVVLSYATSTIANPYKFRVSQNAAASSGNGAFAVVAFDTEQYDTSGNILAGVFTAPVAGFYHFDWGISITTSGAEIVISALFVNGAEYTRGVQNALTTLTIKSVGSDTVQMAAGDTADVRAFCSATRSLNVGNTNGNTFAGFFVCNT